MIKERFTMEHKIYHENDMQIGKWMGGTTKELAIFPQNSKYLDRNFIWRVSSATIEVEESNFTKLPDYNRVLMVLDGDVVLAHQDERVARLKQYEQDRFDGAFKTRSFGKITDYNLMTLKGNEGFLTYIQPTEQPQQVTFNNIEGFHKNSFGFFCAKGYAVVTLNGQSIMVCEGQQLVIDGECDETYHISVMGEGALIQAEIYYNETNDEFAPVEIPKEPVSFDDWKCSMYLANSQFRGAKYIFKRKKEEWYDEALGRVIDILEKTGLTTMFFLIGVEVILLLAYKTCSDLEMIGLIGIWLVVDSLVVSPLLYLIAAPKPVRKHIKKISELTPYEEKVRQSQIESNPRIQRILDNTITGNPDFKGPTGLFGKKK